MFSSKITTRCLIGVAVEDPESAAPRSTLPPDFGAAGVAAPPLPQLGWASANVRPSAAAAAVPATATGRRAACLIVRGSLATSSPPHGAELGRLLRMCGVRACSGVRTWRPRRSYSRVNFREASGIPSRYGPVITEHEHAGRRRRRLTGPADTSSARTA